MDTNSLGNIYLPKPGKRRRASSYDRSGGNDDRYHISSGKTMTIFDVHSSGVIEHIWMTMVNEGKAGDEQEENAFRKVYLEFYYEDSPSPSVRCPIGDFFGMGHGKSKNFVSAPFQMSPEDGRGLNCYFPIPYRKACRIDVTNFCERGLLFYFYIDYREQEMPANILYFGAVHHEEKPKGVPYENFPNRAEFLFGGENKDGKDNYVMLDVEGEGHYVGCNFNILNDNPCPDWDWPGEGDDMIYIDGEKEPSIYGTGTEDYFSTAWCPSQEYSAPYHGIILGGKDNWKGEITYYRYHILDPINFYKSIKVTIEHGHNNHRSDALSSTAYFYLDRPYLTPGSLLPPEKK